jgi:hypothetical protein
MTSRNESKARAADAREKATFTEMKSENGDQPADHFRMPSGMIDEAEDAENPFLQVLGPTKSAAEVSHSLIFQPTFDEAERDLPDDLRRQRLELLAHVHTPVPAAVRIYQTIDRMMRATYRRTNPNKVRSVQQLFAGRNGVVHASDDHRPVDGGSCLLIPGITGAGKSNLMRAIRAQYPLVVNHAIRSKQKLQAIQIPILRVRVSGEPSYASLGRDIGQAIFKRVGENPITRSLNRKEIGLDRISDLISQATLTYNVGFLVLDEFQEVVGKSSNDARRMTRMLMDQRDTSHVGIAYVGNYGMLRPMQCSARFSRRHAAGRFSLDRFERDSTYWRDIVQVYWNLQWVREPQELTDEIRTTIYELTQGIPGYLRALMDSAQTLAIGDGETIDKDILEDAYLASTSMNHLFIQALASGDREVIANHPDIFNPFDSRDILKELHDTIDARAERERLLAVPRKTTEKRSYRRRGLESRQAEDRT